jgi:hypothetical protein
MTLSPFADFDDIYIFIHAPVLKGRFCIPHDYTRKKKFVKRKFSFCPIFFRAPPDGEAPIRFSALSPSPGPPL